MKSFLLASLLVFSTTAFSRVAAKKVELTGAQKAKIAQAKSKILSKYKAKLLKSKKVNPKYETWLGQESTDIYTRSECMLSGMSVCNMYDTDCLDDVTYICEQYPDL